MPIIKSAKKRLRQSEVRREANLSVRTRVKNARRSFIQTAEGEDAEAKQAAYKTYCSVLDKAVKQGVISRNTSIRRKTRAAERIRVKAPEAAPAVAEVPAETTDT